MYDNPLNGEAMIKTVHAVRIVLGIFLFLNGMNMWLGILPISSPRSGPAFELMNGLVLSGLFEYVKIIEIVTGLLFIFNIFVPLALAVMAPLVFVIAFTDFILLGTPNAIAFGVAMVLLWGIPMWAYLPYFFGLFRMKAQPECVSFDDIASAVTSKQKPG